jgi:formate dehydrogenase (coenzyme F420) beta subunit
MVKQLHQLCRELLASGRAQVIIGYGQKHPDIPPYPLFVTTVEGVEQLVWNDQCAANLVAYLKRKEVKALGKPAIVVKGCDAKALVVLKQEAQIDREQMVIIGMACGGIGEPRLPKCAACDVHMPQQVDITIGEAPAETVDAARRYSELDVFMTQTTDERMVYWQDELERCTKCYACRQVCPLCYCERCVVDKNRPARVSTPASLKGNYAWQITRAFHLAGRCIGCDECTRACPAGINLRLLNLSLSKAAEASFAYRAGTDPQAEPVIGACSGRDQESFIG